MHLLLRQKRLGNERSIHPFVWWPTMSSDISIGNKTVSLVVGGCCIFTTILEDDEEHNDDDLLCVRGLWSLSRNVIIIIKIILQ